MSYIFTGGTNADDVITGVDGDDVLDDGAGSDIVSFDGREGDDVITTGWRSDFIAGGDRGEDHVQVATTAPIDFDYVMQHATQVGSHTVITIDGSVMIFENVQLTGLTPADFAFDLVLA